mmetsp:Transcript_113731/g.308980  ORF Transcript_113731/g.308980 Transcript_113731/m.308980 type:complete len:288 (-) Transcript_113731:406-1269(-)
MSATSSARRFRSPAMHSPTWERRTASIVSRRFARLFPRCSTLHLSSAAMLAWATRSSAAARSSLDRSPWATSTKQRRASVSFANAAAADAPSAEPALRWSSTWPWSASSWVRKTIASWSRFSASSQMLWASCSPERARASSTSVCCLPHFASRARWRWSVSRRNFCSKASTPAETSSMPRPRSPALCMKNWCSRATSSFDSFCSCAFSLKVARSLRKSSAACAWLSWVPDSSRRRSASAASIPDICTFCDSCSALPDSSSALRSALLVSLWASWPRNSSSCSRMEDS